MLGRIFRRIGRGLDIFHESEFSQSWNRIFQVREARTYTYLVALVQRRRLLYDDLGTVFEYERAGAVYAYTGRYRSYVCGIQVYLCEDMCSLDFIMEYRLVCFL